MQFLYLQFLIIFILLVFTKGSMICLGESNYYRYNFPVEEGSIKLEANRLLNDLNNKKLDQRKATEIDSIKREDEAMMMMKLMNSSSNSSSKAERNSMNKSSEEYLSQSISKIIENRKFFNCSSKTKVSRLVF